MNYTRFTAKKSLTYFAIRFVFEFIDSKLLEYVISQRLYVFDNTV